MRGALVTLLSVFCTLCLVLPAESGGVSIWAVGAKAKAMGGAFRAVSDDWSAAYYNPAGLYYVTENQFSINENITHYRFQYTPMVTYGDYEVGYYNGSEIRNHYEIITNPMLGGFIKVPLAGRKFVMGLSVFQPFDANLSWNVFQNPNNNAALPGRQIEHNFDAVAINWIGTYELLEDQLSIGVSAGLLKADHEYGGFFLRPNPIDSNAPYYSDIAGRPNELITQWQKSEGAGYAPNFRFGVLYKPTSKLRVGATFAPGMSVTAEGNVEMYFYMPDIPSYHNRTDVRTSPDSINFILSSGATYRANATYQSEITLPTQLALGLAYQLSERMLVTGDVEYNLWSSYDGYHFDYAFADSNVTRNAELNEWMVSDMALPVKWRDTWRAGLGLQYTAKDWLLLRGGYSADQSPYDEDEGGGLHPAYFDTGLKHSAHLGFGLVFEHITIDVATQYIHFPETTEKANVNWESNGDTDNIVDNMAGTYKGTAWESIVQFTVRF